MAIPEYPDFDVSPIPGVNFVDASKQTVGANLERYGQAFDAGLGYAARLSDTWIPRMRVIVGEQAPFIRRVLADDNRFNQEQLLQANEYGVPGGRKSVLDALKRANTYAQGRLINTIEDRAFETVSRSMAADSTFLRGYGDDSTFGRKTSELLSAKDRLNLAMQGEGLLQGWLQTANQMFVDQPIKSNVGSQVPAIPVNEPAAATGIANYLGGFNMLPATAQPEADLRTQMFNAEIALQGYQARFAAEQGITNAWQGAFNADASFIEQQMALDAMRAGQRQAATGQAIGSIATIAAAALTAF